MEPSRLIWVTDDITFEVPEVPSGLIEECVPVPGRCAEIPEVRDDKKQNPKEEECCFWIGERLETDSQLPPVWREGAEQKEDAEQPPDRLPWVSPTRSAIMRGTANDADHQTDD